MRRYAMTDKFREIDTRTVPGNGGTVALYMGGVDDPYEVHVLDCQGERTHTIYATTRASALEAFWHPFAAASTPNPFERVRELVEAS